MRRLVAVLGGGAAGLAAAAFARSAGAEVMLLDEPGPADPTAWDAPVIGTRVWSVAREADGFRLDGLAAAGPVVVHARALIVCAGSFGAPHRTPSTEATRLLGATHAFVAARGGWVPVLDHAQRCDVAGLYAAGDCAGLGGDAVQEGRTAAHAALTDLGRAVPATPLTTPRHDMSATMDRFAAACAALGDEAIVCPCEGLSQAAVLAAIAAGARDVNQLKSFTRAGMGPCQGRLCNEVVAELVGRHLGSRARAGIATARVPLRPVPMSALLGAFDYADIPVPAPAPI